MTWAKVAKLAFYAVLIFFAMALGAFADRVGLFPESIQWSWSGLCWALVFLTGFYTASKRWGEEE